MTEPLSVPDLSTFEPRHPKVAGYNEAAWLERLQEHLRASDHVIRLGEHDLDDEDFVISRDSYGRWQTGRYIGELAFEGRRMEIRPRLGPTVIGRWLEGALNLVAIPETAQHQGAQSFIALLMAAVWCRQVDAAARHGPPAFRRDRVHEGLFVRGGLDVRHTTRLIGRGSPRVASLMRQRELDNDVSRVLVAAERVLTQAIGHNRWRTERVKDVLPQLYAAVGARPRLPSLGNLQRIRFTPITRPFKQAAALSWRIARQEGFGAHADPGHAEGLLLDVAELWELYLLQSVRRVAPELRVEHGTTESRRTLLLTSIADDGFGLGRLKPDILVWDRERLVAVVDAKYKRLRDVWPDRPAGVDRGDLYQLTSYLSALDPAGAALGALLYPDDPDDPSQEKISTAELKGPWRTESGSTVFFDRVPIERDGAEQMLRGLLSLDERQPERPITVWSR